MAPQEQGPVRRESRGAPEPARQAVGSRLPPGAAARQRPKESAQEQINYYATPGTWSEEADSPKRPGSNWEGAPRSAWWDCRRADLSFCPLQALAPAPLPRHVLRLSSGHPNPLLLPLRLEPISPSSRPWPLLTCEASTHPCTP